jgi:hypothetical protein
MLAPESRSQSVNAGLCELVCQKPHSIALREPEQMLGFPVASPLCQKVVFGTVDASTVRAG